MDIWEYETYDVKLTDTSGNTYVGCVISAISAEDLQSNEDGLTLETFDDHKILGFSKSEIATIEIIN